MFAPSEHAGNKPGKKVAPDKVGVRGLSDPALCYLINLYKGR